MIGKSGSIIQKTLKFGEAYELNCQSDRNPVRHPIKWFLNTFDGRLIELIEQQKLDIIDLITTKASDGVFECEIDDEMGMVRKQFNITVNALGELQNDPEIFKINFEPFRASKNHKSRASLHIQ